LNLRKWMKLFGMTILIGAVVTVVGSVCIQLFNPDFRDVEASGWLSYVLMMALIGIDVRRVRPYGLFRLHDVELYRAQHFQTSVLWLAIQGFLALFVLIEIAYWTYGSDFPNETYWLLPIGLLAVSLLTAWLKVSQTNPGAWIPTVFFMVSITVAESIPAFRTGDISSLLYQLIPIFICNAYQIMQLHKILSKSEARGPTVAAAAK